MKKAKNTDLLFGIITLAVLLIHLCFLFVVPFSDDESHYVTVPFRLINGESLVQHEWHLTQFASLFTYLPVRIWTAIKGSTEGIFIFLRCVYLAIHTSVAVLVYKFFRKYGIWAIMASVLFYIQMPYRIQAISYQSMFVLFLLLFMLCLMSIYEKKSFILYILAGLCLGCCCVGNPLFCGVFVLYLIGCILWTKRDKIINKVVSLKASQNKEKKKKLTKKQKREMKQKQTDLFPEIENYNCFFTKEAIIGITVGLLIVALIAAAFFFMTGGTVKSIFDNVENLLGSSEYDVASESVFGKLWKAIEFFTMANLNLPFILPVLLIALLFDKKRKTQSHRIAYLMATLVWSVLFIVGVMMNLEIYVCAISLPFSVMSFVCYVLTEKKNKPLFLCMFVPCLIASVFHFVAADTLLGAIGVVLAVSNVSGVFFAKDLWNEMRTESAENTDEVKTEKPSPLRNLIIVAFCVQIGFYGLFYMYGQIYGADAPKAEAGPYKGLYMSETEYEKYNKCIDDMDYIKEISNTDDPVLFVSYKNWMYLYMERPFAVHTTWYRGRAEFEVLAKYYEENPEKTPEYIYIESPDPENTKVDIYEELFVFTRENLSNGVLLTVTG